ncbi:solute carrier family 2, facilitated glucose transporter member 8 [Pseudopipra pipra]|uniref:solute carrier family 2, facilitated glucose transporter member 8 n=1 Tax=Pseudopipra pipra TaxID=415032 RepID=UPI003139EEEE
MTLANSEGTRLRPCGCPELPAQRGVPARPAPALPLVPLTCSRLPSLSDARLTRSSVCPSPGSSRPGPRGAAPSHVPGGLTPPGPGTAPGGGPAAGPGSTTGGHGAEQPAGPRGAAAPAPPTPHLPASPPPLRGRAGAAQPLPGPGRRDGRGAARDPEAPRLRK